jgi:hypothetical protein
LRNKYEYVTILKNLIMKKVIVQFNVPGVNTRKYDQAWEEVRKLGHSNPKGLLHHVGGMQGNNLIVIDVWESLEAFNKYGEILMPVLGKLGFPQIQPTIIPVHYEYNSLSAGAIRGKAA